MSLPLLADSMVSVGGSLSLDANNLPLLCPQLIALSLKYVDRRGVWESVFPGLFVDWPLVRPHQNLLGDLHLWLPLLELCSWGDAMDRLEAHHPPLHGLRRAMTDAGLDDGGWTLRCQLFLLQWLQGIPCLQALQLCSCRALKRDTHQSCALLLAALSDTPYTPDTVALALQAVLDPKNLTVDASPLEGHLKSARAKREEIAHALQQRSLSSYQGRPRLRDRADPTDLQKLRLDDTLGTWESYTGFCQLHQFPNVLSETVKVRLYVLAAQTGWDWRPHVHRVLRHDGDLAARVGKYPVSNPDLPHLHRSIEALSMDGSPPFQELVDFKNRCFRSFPVSARNRMTLTQALRLYVCAYQNPLHWKELWKGQFPLLSPLIIKDVEAFVASAPFAPAPFMALFLGPSAA